MIPTPFPDIIEAALQRYKASFRKDGLPDWERGELLALFPDEFQGQATRTWHDSWPFGNRAGVYFVFGERMQLLYIGKASMNSCMGARLSNWFWGPSEGTCNVSGTWSVTPRFVQTLAMPLAMPFEAPALEEFLIGVFNPPDNVAGRSRG